VRRDKERADQHKKQKEQNQASDTRSSPVLFQPTPDKLYFETSSACDPVLPTHLQHTFDDMGHARELCARESHDQLEAYNSTSAAPVINHVTEPVSAMECDVNNAGLLSVQCESGEGGGAQPLSGEDKLVRDAEAAGFSLLDIRDAVSKVFDKRRQQCLRDPDRNMRLTKVVLDKRGNNREELICESDDFVLQFDCQQRYLVSWYLKDGKRWQERGYTLDLEDCLHRWPALTDDHYQQEQRLALKLVHTLAAVVRVYLG
jgi:hypothetical protein